MDESTACRASLTVAPGAGNSAPTKQGTEADNENDSNATNVNQRLEKQA